MALNEETNKFEMVKKPTIEELERLIDKHKNILIRPDGSVVPDTWLVFKEDELVVVKDHTFRIAHIGETYVVIEPVSKKINTSSPEEGGVDV